MAQTLNAYHTESVFTHDSIEHAYRVGRHGRGPGHVIVCFHRYQDTMTVTKTRHARQEKASDGIINETRISGSQKRDNRGT